MTNLIDKVKCILEAMDNAQVEDDTNGQLSAHFSTKEARDRTLEQLIHVGFSANSDGTTGLILQLRSTQDQVFIGEYFYRKRFADYDPNSNFAFIDSKKECWIVIDNQIVDIEGSPKTSKLITNSVFYKKILGVFKKSGFDQLCQAVDKTKRELLLIAQGKGALTISYPQEVPNFDDSINLEEVFTRLEQKKTAKGFIPILQSTRSEVVILMRIVFKA